MGNPGGTNCCAILYFGLSPQNDDGLRLVVESGATVSGGILGVYADGTSGTSIIDRQAAATAAATAGTPAVHVHNMAGGTFRDAPLHAADIENDGLLLIGSRLEVTGDVVQGNGGTIAPPFAADGELWRSTAMPGSPAC